jgi:hypothetical protein
MGAILQLDLNARCYPTAHARDIADKTTVRHSLQTQIEAGSFLLKVQRHDGRGRRLRRARIKNSCIA